jgi:hypothetical protein
MEHWKEILIGAAVTLVLTAMFTYVAHLSLIQAFGKHLYDRSFGSRVTEQHYALDEKARRRVRWGTVVAFVIILACTGACVWDFITLVVLAPR